jgi:FtsP/CotA-like multicopper oxidase with cupredoxin domain
VTRPLALIEASATGFDAYGEEVDGPVEALLGVVSAGVAVEKLWMDTATENPIVGDTEVWEFYNTTADAHPMHIHEVAFEVVKREGLVLDDEDEVVQPIQLDGVVMPAESWGTGVKDTVTALPGQVTRVRMHFSNPGQFVWHCHIVEHEDNEMMRPYRIGPVQPGQPDPE